MKKWIIFFLIFAVIITSLLYTYQHTQYKTLSNGTKWIEKIEKENEIDLNTFVKLYKENTFEKIEIIDNNKLKWYKNNWDSSVNSMISWQVKQINYELYKTNKPADTSLNELWLSLTWSTPIDIKLTENSMIWKIFLEQILPLLFFVLVLVILLRLFGPKGWWFPFGVQAWKLKTKADVKTNFWDVAWMEESKDELKEIVDYLKNPTKYKKVWARIPKWVLLYWPPWSWKTLLARAVAGEADVPFFAASGSEFMEMLVWMWAAKVRELFNKAKTSAPSIIFIDEIDTIGKKRWVWYTGWHQEQEQTLNQILTEMDWFDIDTKVIVIAATNRPDILDSALLRPGRFDRKIYIWRPTRQERLEILKIHCKDKTLDKDVELETMAKRTSWFVWADLANIANEAALKVAKENRKEVTMDDFEYALEKIIMWPEKKIKSIKEKERNIIAYHELGHAVTAFNLSNVDPVEKISIVSRWMALWITWMMPDEDRYLYSKAKFLDELVTLLWWRACEEIFFWKNEITTWASNDFEKSTKIASDMILKYWMDEDLGTIRYYDKDEPDYVPFKPFSEQTAQIIDNKIKELISTAYQRAIKILQENKETISKLSEILLEKEYLTKQEFLSIMQEPNKIDKILSEIRSKESQKKHAEKIRKDLETQQNEPNNTNTENNTQQKDTTNEDNNSQNSNNQDNNLWNMLDEYLK